MQNDFILAARANDLDRLNYLIHIEELQIPEIGYGTTARYLASLEAIRYNRPEALALLPRLQTPGTKAERLHRCNHCPGLGHQYGRRPFWGPSEARTQPNTLSLSLDDLDMVQFLLSRGADPNQSYYRFPIWTALEGAAAFNSIPVIEALIDAGAELKSRRVLARAAGKGRIDVVKYLLDRGAPIDTNPRLYDEVNKSFYYDEIVFRSALCEAAFTGQAEVVQLLLERGADPTVRDTDGRSNS
ncbi:ankyrin repeat domain-containing protein [Aspergillus mulundensis]|uniref:Uncharacterized protein n=1 Tax=Aspergillus mulundensis TaxID=1810919 RepID=A0A3D8SBX6_9EURO|nr:hypothetical protein DSM5745_04109 [Aspergillus mulundensis]RDW83783.1 hypothetical protein DSM5745_04109 [Aspergillus mulundensis]